MSEQEKKAEYEYFVDAKPYTSPTSSLTGEQIKKNADVPPQYQLFLEEEGDKPDRAISDGETVSLTHGSHHKPAHFFAVPAATFGDL